MPATAPATMPRISFETFSVSSALASAISSRTRSWTFSVTSWMAPPRSEGRGSVIAPRDRLEDLREQEGARERRADQDLGALLGRRGGARSRARRRGGPRRRGRAGGRLGARRGGRADAR